ncbi:MAG: alpha/beta fold hydrolase [Verrucomicrobiales bacterium]|nr:alpha/beta fold hydrolase [Verrucomicrobiales bacterium]
MPTLAATLLLIGIFLTLVIWIGSTRLIVPNRRALEQRHYDLLAAPAEYGMALDHFEIKTGDGHTLKSIVATRSPTPGAAPTTRAIADRLIGHGIAAQNEPRATIILLHGRGGRKEDMLSIAKRFVAADFRCVVYDARAHGKSGGTYSTFGKLESHDLGSVVAGLHTKIANEGGAVGPIGFFGNSLGAAVALQSLESMDLSEAIVAVSPFASLPEIVERSGRRMIHRHLPDWLTWCCMKVGGWRAGFNPHAIAPVDSVKKSITPIFVVHGSLDGVIPVSHGREVYDASPSNQKKWREISTGYHGNVLAEGGDDLYEEMILFYLRHLPDPEFTASERRGEDEF